MKVANWKWSGLAVLAALLVCLPSFSQVNLGRLSGTVTDESGGSMANAKVTVTDQERGVSRVLTADEAGAYSAPGLTPGIYTVRAEAAGFNTTERKDVQVPVGGDVRADVSMKAGSQTQTVTVTESVPLINTTSATLGGVMAGSEVQDLPVIAHNYQQLLQFTPGVVSKPGGGSNGHSSNGLRSDGNNWLFEGLFSGGVRTAGSIINTNSSTGDGASVVPPDAIQEMAVSFQNKAEYGWRPGVASNVGVKSGTNSIHGTAFAQGQTNALNARNIFNPAPQTKPDLSYQQYGATAGGPIKKDKLFWFAAFEGIQFTQGTPTNHKIATTALIANDATNSIPAAYLDIRAKALAATAAGWTGCPASCPINPAAISATGTVNAALLNPQQALSANLVNTGIFQTGLPDSKGFFPYALTSRREPSKNLLGKVDYHLSDKHQISGEYFWARDTELGESQGVLQQYWLTDFYLTSNVARANWTYLPSSNLVNEFHFGFDRKVENQWPAECVPGRVPTPPSFGWSTGVQSCLGAPTGNDQNFSLPTITINGFDNLGGGGGQRRVEGYPAWVDNISYTRGNHNIKFGFEMRRNYFQGGSYTGKKGSVSFGSSTSVHAFANSTPLQDFLMGYPSTGSFTFGNPVTTDRNWAYGWFVQDDWRITPRVTINAGLRWEYQTALVEDDNRIARFDPTSATGLSQVGSGLNAPWTPHKDNFQPRLGVVWDVTGKGSTVVRAAWGMYDAWPVWSVINGVNNNPSGALFFRTDGTTVQGTGTIANASISFPTNSGTAITGGTAIGATPVVWNAAGPTFPVGQISCGDGVTTPAGKPRNPAACSLTQVDSSFKIPIIQQWTVAIQRAIGSNMSLDVAYVGNHGSRLFGTTDINFPGAGSNDTTRIQKSRPYYGQFPWFGNINVVTNRDYSNYNGLQMTLNQRAWHGLTQTVGYTYSHTLDVAGTDLSQAVYADITCPRCNYGPTPFDIRHRVTIRQSYNFPSKTGYAQMLEGWSVSSVINLQGATPWDTSDTRSNFSGTGKGERWDIFGDPDAISAFGKFDHVPCFGVSTSTFGKDSACTSVANINLMPQACLTAADSLRTNPNVAGSSGRASLLATGCYVAGDTVIVPPAQGTFGNMSKGIFRSDAFRNWDMSVRKGFRFTERFRSEFQFDMYNVTNTPHFSIPGGNGNTSSNSLAAPAGFGSSAATPNVSNGNVVGGSGDARRYQFGLKLLF